MAEIKVPIQVNLPDDWVEQIVDRLRNDPDAEWVEIIRCKDCKWYGRVDKRRFYRGMEYASMRVWMLKEYINEEKS